MYRFFLFSFILFFSCLVNANPKYVFVLISDGYGAAQQKLIRQVKKAPLVAEKLNQRFSMGTLNALKKTTDSAASGTAISTGHKTINGYVGLTADKQHFPSIIETAKENGYKTAVLTTVPITDATPATAYAAHSNREDTATLAKIAATSNIDFFVGNGLHDMQYLPKMSENGYAVLPCYSENLPPNQKIFLNCPLKMNWQTHHAENSLSKNLEKVIKYFDEKPFTIWLETEETDNAGHDHDAGYLYRAAMEFDNTVQVALDFYNQHPEDTLLIVLSDHETGGLQLFDLGKANPELIVAQQGPKEELLFRFKDSESVNWATLAEQFLNITLDDKEKKQLQQIETPADATNAAFAMRDKKAGFRYTNPWHTNAKVPLYVSGTDSFSAPVENSDIGAVVKELIQ